MAWRPGRSRDTGTGAEPSGGGWTAPPGQRRMLPELNALSRFSPGPSGESTSPAGGGRSVRLNGLKIGWIRA